MTNVSLPSKVSINLASKLIEKLNFIFKLEGQKKENYKIDLSSIKKIDVFGLSLIMKFIEYSVEKECFVRPELLCGEDDSFFEAIEQYGFTNLIKEYVKINNSGKILKSLKVIEKESFFIAPHALLRGQRKVKKNFDRKLTSVLKDFYGEDNIEFIENVLACAAEISSNFYNHAVDDSKTLLVARGTKTIFEIVCIDAAEGIPTSLRTLEIYKKLTNVNLIELAAEKEVTSKPRTAHMGYGLWLVKQIVSSYDGHLEIISEDARFTINKGTPRSFGNPFWSGSIIYLKIPFKYGVNLGSILKKNRKKNNFNIEINFG